MSDRGGPSAVPALAFNVLEAEEDDGGDGRLPDASAANVLLPHLPQLPQMVPASPTAVAVPQVGEIF